MDPPELDDYDTEKYYLGVECDKKLSRYKLYYLNQLLGGAVADKARNRQCILPVENNKFDFYHKLKATVNIPEQNAHDLYFKYLYSTVTDYDDLIESEWPFTDNPSLLYEKLITGHQMPNATI